MVLIANSKHIADHLHLALRARFYALKPIHKTIHAIFFFIVRKKCLLGNQAANQPIEKYNQRARSGECLATSGELWWAFIDETEF